MKKILVVDNDRLILQFIQKKLSKRGYHVVTAADGLSALDILRTYTPDIVFIDLIMPNIDGKKLCKIIRGLPKLKDVFLIILSAIGAEDEPNIAELGANVYVAKGPLAEMAQNILAVLDRIEHVPSQCISEEVVGITTIFPRQITRELLSAKRHYEIILERITEGVLEITSEGRIIYANSTALALIGIAENNLLGLRLIELFAKDDRQRIDEMLKTSGDQSRQSTYNSPVRLNEHQVTLTILPINGNESTYLIILKNVSEQKRTEDALKEGEERYRAVLEVSPDPVVVSDMTGKALYVNPAFTKVFGWKPEELLGQRIDYVPEESWPETLKMIEKVMAGESFSGTESRRYSKKGHIVDVTISGAIYRDRNGTPQGCVINLRDITEQKKLQAQLQHAQKMKTIGTIASGVAHNFNNILTGISVDNQLMQMKFQDNPALLEIVVRTDKYIKGGSQLVAELMQFSHGKTRKFQVFNLAEVIRATYQLINQSFDKNIRVHLDIPEQLPVVGNHSGLNQVFMNLCINAKDAMPGGGDLRIEAKKEGSNALVTISDTGHGMDEETRSKCFDPFFTTKEVGKGTGLGLFTAYGIIKDHGGEIHLDSEQNKGTIFKLYFPMASAGEEYKKMAWPEIV